MFLRLRYLSGSLQGKAWRSAKTLVRIGRAPDCDVRFDKVRDPKVSNHHAEIMLEDGAYYVVDVGSTNGTLVNGRRVVKHKLNAKDQLTFGQGGPEAEFTFEGTVDAHQSGGGVDSGKTEVTGSALTPEMLAGYLDGDEAEKTVKEQGKKIQSELKASADTSTANLADLAAQRIAEERKKAGGKSSGQTMFIMAETLQKVQSTTKTTSKKKWVKVVAAVAGGALVVVSVMGVVIWQQKKQIDALVTKKVKIDKDIRALELQLQEETDPARLEEMEQRLATLTGSAERTISELGQKDKGKAAEVAEAGDDLDREIRKILRKFDAATYTVPPIFKERLRAHIDELKDAGNLKLVYRRKKRYWPMIQREFSALGLPEEMAYVAWAETQFDPEARSAAGALGMWQFTKTTAQAYGLRIDGKVDERTDAEKLTRAAARYLANLLAEFGADSFMLAMASYNRGEAGVRRVLRQVAQEQGGFRKEKRDFWHLYRLKKLPPETREYVPKILAAAVVCQNPQKYGLEGAGKALASDGPDDP